MFARISSSTSSNYNNRSPSRCTFQRLPNSLLSYMLAGKREKEEKEREREKAEGGRRERERRPTWAEKGDRNERQHVFRKTRSNKNRTPKHKAKTGRTSFRRFRETAKGHFRAQKSSPKNPGLPVQSSLRKTLREKNLRQIEL